MEYAIVSDIHFGEKGDSSVHNQDLHEFFLFLVDHRNTHRPKCRTLLIGGDVFHQRDKLGVITINRAIETIEYLNRQFDEIICIKGNHDLPYRDSLEDCSLNIFEWAFEDFLLVDKNEFIEDNFLLTSWISSAEEYDDLIRLTKKKKTEILLGHLEFVSFKMNDHYVMEHGMTHRSLKHIDKIFSGHYHMRQTKDNVHYIGTPFPFNFNDANDSDRGFMYFDSSNLEHEYVNYDEIKILSMDHETFLSEKFNSCEKTSVRVTIDEIVDDSVVEEIGERINTLGFRESKVLFTVNKIQEVLSSDGAELTEIMSIDQAISSNLSSIREEGVNTDLLVEIFQKMKRKHE